MSKRRDNKRSQKRNKNAKPSGVEDRHHLLRCNLQAAMFAWEQAVDDPVVLVLDIRDPLASQVALACGQSRQGLEAHRRSLQGIAIPTLVAVMNRRAVTEFAKEHSDGGTIARHLADGPVGGCMDVVVVASGGNTFARVPVDLCVLH